jgi:hypothetical protein
MLICESRDSSTNNRPYLYLLISLEMQLFFSAEPWRTAEIVSKHAKKELITTHLIAWYNWHIKVALLFGTILPALQKIRKTLMIWFAKTNSFHTGKRTTKGIVTDVDRIVNLVPLAMEKDYCNACACVRARMCMCVCVHVCVRACVLRVW